MKNNHNIITNLIKSLENSSEEKRLEYGLKSYPSKLKIIGVNSKNQDLILKDMKIETKNYNVDDKIEFAKELVSTDIFEVHRIAYKYLGSYKNVLDKLTIDDIEFLGQNLDNWVLVDLYSINIIGYCLREGKIDLEFVKDYFKSSDVWIRRIPLSATIALNQKANGGKGDSKRTLEICSLAVNDHEAMISKALSWALRELVKVDRDSVVKFINSYEKELDKKVLREVRKKIETGKKI